MDHGVWEDALGKIVEVKSKATTVNPKDLMGSVKVSITKFPAIGTIMGAMAMGDGAVKYGPFNWREKDVIASIYVDAAYRHLMAWFEGQENATDSKVHHLGHAIACCAILLDAQALDTLIDDRPVVNSGAWLNELFDVLSETIKQKAAS
jgi:Domain of unknown function (DUF5664)